ncbi:hypothetical protein FACS18945_4820 [Bacteroidia bacterium]|nr:hypothetical protein FACS18945_4820 [Bacteroidia bacterium]
MDMDRTKAEWAKNLTAKKKYEALLEKDQSDWYLQEMVKLYKTLYATGEKPYGFDDAKRAIDKNLVARDDKEQAQAALKGGVVAKNNFYWKTGKEAAHSV